MMDRFEGCVLQQDKGRSSTDAWSDRQKAGGFIGSSKNSLMLVKTRSRVEFNNLFKLKSVSKSRSVEPVKIPCDQNSTVRKAQFNCRY